MIAIDRSITKSSSPTNRAYSSPKHTNMINVNTGSLLTMQRLLGMKLSSWRPSMVKDPLLLGKKNQMRVYDRSLQVAMDKSLKRRLHHTYRPRKRYRKDLLRAWVKVALLEGHHRRIRQIRKMTSRLCFNRVRCLVRAFNQKSTQRKWLELTKRWFSQKNKKNIVLKYLNLLKIPWTDIMLRTNVR